MKKYEYDYKALDFRYEGKPYKVRGKADPKRIEKLRKSGASDEAVTEEVERLALLDAELKKTEKIRELEKGAAAVTKEKQDTLFKTYAEKWFNTHNKKVIKSTRADIKTRMDKYLLPYLGHIRLKDISRSDCIDCLSHMEGMSKDRIMKTRQVMKRIFTAAVDDGYITKVPNVRADDLPYCKEAAPRRAITSYERDIILKVSEYHPGGTWVLTMLFCGLRPGETAALQGRHIDRKNSQFIIEEAQKSDGNTGDTKTQAGRRIVPIPSHLLSRLPKVDPFEYVFKSPFGNPLTKKSMNDQWHNFKRSMNIAAGVTVYRNELRPSMDVVEGCGRGCLLMYPEYIINGIGKRDMPIDDLLTPYYLRHTFCTDCVTAGIPIETLKDLAGHKSISITAKFYVHMNKERMNHARDLLEIYHATQGVK